MGCWWLRGWGLGEGGVYSCLAYVSGLILSITLILSYACSVFSIFLSSGMAVAVWYASRGFVLYSLMGMEAVRQISGVRGIHQVLSMWDIVFVDWIGSLFRSLLKDQRMISLSVAVEAYVLGALPEAMCVSIFSAAGFRGSLFLM